MSPISGASGLEWSREKFQVKTISFFSAISLGSYDSYGFYWVCVSLSFEVWKLGACFKLNQPFPKKFITLNLITLKESYRFHDLDGQLEGWELDSGLAVW